MSQTIDEIIRKYLNTQRDSLIPILQEIQEELGYLSEEAIIKVGEYLKLPSSKIYSVATFYDQFRFEPKGKFNIRICRGTACHVIGSEAVLREVERQLKISAGQTTRDGMFSIEVVNCIGACGIAPVIAINGDFYSKITPANIKGIIQSCKEKSI
jgi:NADH-quinone oxidoreductase subunit E